MDPSAPPNLIGPFKPSERADWRKFSKLALGMNRMNAGLTSPQIRANLTSFQDVITYLTISSILPNYLICTYNLISPLQFVVAKPTMLRATNVGPRNVLDSTGAVIYTVSYSAYSSDGQQRTATRSSDSTTEAQVVDDAYQAGDVIWAMVYSDNIRDISGNAIFLIDMNIDARHWAKAAS